jgi:16S rRNA (cytosine1402-N4)-methyltransferase
VSNSLIKYHVPVLSEELINGLVVKPKGKYIDCTLGEAGHTHAVLNSVNPAPMVLGIDLDVDALSSAKHSLENHSKSVILVNGNFNNLKTIAAKNDFSNVDGVFFDLGLSSLQLGKEGRGFSFKTDDYLDMRFDKNQDFTAWDVINTYHEKDISRIVANYGEETKPDRIAKAIVANRPIDTTSQLSNVVIKALKRPWSKIHPATRTFQAIRMEVNGEMENLESALHQSQEILNPGGRLAVISYHSLEDRLVKKFLTQRHREGDTLRIINKKVIKPSRTEILSNRRSRSARMRVAERI